MTSASAERATASDALLQECFSLAVTAWLTARLTRACFVDGQLAALHFDILEPLMAAWASLALGISTNPKPRGGPSHGR